jgi:hypothetical protein
MYIELTANLSSFIVHAQFCVIILLRDLPSSGLPDGLFSNPKSQFW